MSLNLVFAGTPPFAAETLKALLNTSHHLQAVYTQPDRPAGRGRALQQSAVKAVAAEYSLPVYQPLSLKKTDAQLELQSLKPDVLIVVAYGLILPKAILTIPRYGCLNVHASLLPRWRGAAPIQRSILAGDKETGICIMQMDEGLDTGDILKTASCPITEEETSLSLYPKLQTLGTEALLQTLDDLEKGRLLPKKQGLEASYAAKITKEEARIDWHQSAIQIDRQIRAFNPVPTAFTEWGEDRIRIWQSRPSSTPSTAPAGTLLKVHADSLEVATGENTLHLLEIQFAGGKRLSIPALLNSKKALFQENQSRFH